MYSRILKPSSFLAPYIKMYWTFENVLNPGEKCIQRIIPNGLPEIIFYLEDIPEILTEKRHLKSHSMISGQKNDYYDLVISGKTKLFSIIFEPFGLPVFFDMPVSEIFNRSVPLRFIVGPRLDELEDLLYKTKHPEEQQMIVEKFLFQQLIKKQNYQLGRISESIKRMNLSGGGNPVPQLASHVCLSRKQYERTFNDLVGISPKQFLRVIRFQRALFGRQNHPGLKLTEFACDAGYFDQSHMISEFKQFSGLTPKQFFEQCPPFSDYFVSR